MRRTEESLTRREWWWHHENSIREKLATVWPVMEDGAHAYELVRRLHREKKLPSFPSLTATQRGELFYYNGRKNYVVTTFGERLSNDETKLSWPIRFNLEAPDHQLVENFWEFIAMQRKLKRAVSCMDGRKKGRFTVSWAWPEIMDISYFNVRKLSESERRTLRKAKSKARQESEKIFRLLSF